MIVVIGRVVARSDRLAEALSLSRQHVERSRKEPGCISHAVHQDTEDPNRLVFVEEWADQAALLAHFNVPASRSFARALTALASEPPRMTVYDAKELPVR